MKRHHLTIIITFLTVFLAMAQGESSYTLCLKAVNGMENAQIEAKFYILDRDSIAVDSIFTPVYFISRGGNKSKYMNTADIVVKAVPGSEKLLKIVCPGFETEMIPLKFPEGKNRTVEMHDIKLWPVRSSIELDEVVVKHSRVKMVMKGDTIIFDAAKFQLAHGDMLSQMVRQMEGLSIENGVIYMNGRKVDDLLVNGESFFKGDASVALNNLPAFTIRNIKFYEKDPDSAYLTGLPIGEEKDYVLDVTLKKEYVTGYLGNLEAGYGTKDRYIGRGFGLGFGQNFRLSAFANLNNLQNVQTATSSSDGDWDSRGTGNDIGLADRQLAGIDYIWNTSKEIKLKGEVSFQHNTQQNDGVVSTTNFLESGDTYSRENYYNHRREFRLSTNHTWQLSKPKFFMEIKPQVDYNNFNINNLSLSALYDHIPGESRMGEAVDSLFSKDPSPKWKEGLIYSRYRRLLSRPDGLGMRLFYNSRIKFSADATDYLSLAAFVKYSDQKNPGLDEYDLSYAEAAVYDDSFTRMQNSKNHSTEWEGCLAYDWRTAPDSHDVVYSIRPYASFNSRHASNSNLYHPLDGIDYVGTWPSIEMNDAIQAALDRQNSNWSTQHTNNAKFRMEFSLAKSMRLLQVTANAGVNRRHSSMNFDRPDFTQRISRNDWLPEASFNISHTKQAEKHNTSATFKTSYQVGVPELTDLVDYRNTLDPLNIHLPNPNLKRPSTISMNLNGSYYDVPLSMGMNLYGSGQFFINHTEQGRVYDSVTGSTTWTPVSVNGSNYFYLGFNSYFNIHKGLRGNVGYWMNSNRSVGILTDQTFSGRNVVDYILHDPSIGLSWTQTDLSVRTNFSYGFSRSHSTRPGYGNNSFREPNLYCSIEYKCPWKMKLLSDFSAQFNKGNDNDAMNSNSLFWTIRVSQPFYGDKWTVTLTFSDILNSRKDIWTGVNDRAATTHWQQHLPRYVMATVAYRFHFNPGK